MRNTIEIDALDAKWQFVGRLVDSDDNQARRHREIGLFMAVQNNVIVYIGMGREKKGGLGKRIRDFVRHTPSARTHPGGLCLHHNQDDVDIYILPIPKRDDITKLRWLLIQRYKPAWNRNKPISR